MTIYHPLLSVAQVREMERAVIAAETEPDQTMRKAASAVVKTAQWMAGIPELSIPQKPSVLVLVGSGGNGGDGLYVAAALVEAGWTVTVALMAEKVHERGLTAVQGTSARVIGFEKASQEQMRDVVRSTDLVIDAILGIGGHGGLRTPAAPWIGAIQGANIPILSVDTPSGVDVDTGYAHGVTVRATVSVTFGAFRRVHGFSAQSGVVVLADCGLGEAARKLVAHDPEIEWGTRVVGPDALKDLPDGLIGFGALPAEPVWWNPARWPQEAAEPDPSSDKYSGGVAGLCTGSEQYPGAAVLSTGGAVKTTSSMVRYAGQCSGVVLQSYPEVVASPSIAETGRVQSWAVGSGQDSTLAYKNLHHLVGTDQPLVVDAGALTALAEDISSGGGSLLVRIRSRTAATVLTPHAGEFAHIAGALADAQGVEIPDPTADPLAAAQELAEYLGAIVLLKGRTTILSDGTHTFVVDAGCSWAATPGSGDVLAGILGALLAEQTPVGDTTLSRIAEGVRTQALAAELSARVAIPGTDRFGYSSASASRIVDAISAARALEATRPRGNGCWNDAS